MKGPLGKLLTLVLLLGSSVCACAQNAAPARLTGSQRMELELLGGQLADPERSAKTKVEAAELLLTREYPEATALLHKHLSDAQNPQAQVAVAEAVARHGGGDASFIEPLMGMLTGTEASASVSAGKALATYKNHGVMEKLIALARETQRPRAVRLTTISTLTVMLDKQAVDALVSLLDDKDEGIRQAAAEALAKMTSIRAFGNDAEQWRLWWQRNRNKRQAEWLSDLADSLARSKVALESDNSRLRERLAQAMVDLHASTPAAQRPALILKLLKDSLGDVRLAGLNLLLRQVSLGQQVDEACGAQVRVLLADSDSRLRQAAAMLVAAQGDTAALDALLERLGKEQNMAVRQALVTALGQLRDSKAVVAVLGELGNESAGVATAAASALARQAQRQQLDETLRARAVEELLARYSQADAAEKPATLCEALLTAMGVIADKAFVPALKDGLSSPAATVRLAAVKSLSRCGDAGMVALLDGLVRDADRGVRQAAIVAIGELNGQERLAMVLDRTRAENEADAQVRQQAWDVAMLLLSRAQTADIRKAIDSLASRADAAPQRIRMMQMLVERHATTGDSGLADSSRELGLALLKAGRAPEAPAQLAKAHELAVAAKRSDVPEIWTELVGAMLETDDARVIKMIAQSEHEQAKAKALELVWLRLEKLRSVGKWPAAVALSQAAMEQLDQLLSEQQKETLKQALADAQAQQAAQDRQQVKGLLPGLSGDDAARKAAQAQLATLGERAIAPLVAELRACVDCEQPDAALEKTILQALAGVAPRLNGYDTSAQKDVKLKTIESWKVAGP